MKEFRTLKEYIEASLFLYPSIFKCRFDVLSHMFLVNGNGLSVTVNKIIASHDMKHPDEVENKKDFLNKREKRLENNGTTKTFLEVFKDEPEKIAKFLENKKEASRKRVELALNWKDSYNTEPEVINLYPFSREFLPFVIFKNTKFPDLQEQIEYFCNIIENYEIDIEKFRNSLNLSKFLRHIEKREVSDYEENIIDWKDYIYLLRNIAK